MGGGICGSILSAMARIYPPSFVKKCCLPSSEGEKEERAFLIRKSALFLYFTFFVLVFLTLTGLDASFPGVLGYATNISSQDVIELTNQERSKAGLGTLKANAVLSEAAEAKARDMFLKDYWAHNSPDGREPWDFIDEAGYVYLSAGENLAKDFNHSDSVVRAWMNSPTHRDNIVNSNFEEIGVAVVDGELNGFKTTLVVQMFGTPQPSYTANIGGEESEAAAEVEAEEARQLAEQQEPEAQGKKTEIALSPVGERPQMHTQAFAGRPLVERVKDFRWVRFGITAGLVCGTFVALLFALDLLFVSKKHKLKLTLRDLAHLGLLIFLLFGIWYTQVGSIL